MKAKGKLKNKTKKIRKRDRRRHNKFSQTVSTCFLLLLLLHFDFYFCTHTQSILSSFNFVIFSLLSFGGVWFEWAHVSSSNLLKCRVCKRTWTNKRRQSQNCFLSSFSFQLNITCNATKQKYVRMMFVLRVNRIFSFDFLYSHIFTFSLFCFLAFLFFFLRKKKRNRLTVLLPLQSGSVPIFEPIKCLRSRVAVYYQAASTHTHSYNLKIESRKYNIFRFLFLCLCIAHRMRRKERRK